MSNSTVEKLDNLFVHWEKAQVEEVDCFEQSDDFDNYLTEYKCNDDLKKISRRKSFTRDGIINEEKWNSGAKILFILKEANIEGSINKSKVCKDDTFEADSDYKDRFWFKTMVEDGNAEKDRIGRRLKQIGVTLTEDEDFSLQTIAYMNINKRGGLNTANDNVIKGYLAYYKDFIIEEIKIINHDVIVVCCGKNNYAYDLKEVLDKEFQDKERRYYYHPSYFYISSEEYFKGIEL